MGPAFFSDSVSSSNCSCDNFGCQHADAGRLAPVEAVAQEIEQGRLDFAQAAGHYCERADPQGAGVLRLMAHPQKRCGKRRGDLLGKAQGARGRNGLAEQIGVVRGERLSQGGNPDGRRFLQACASHRPRRQPPRRGRGVAIREAICEQVLDRRRFRKLSELLCKFVALGGRPLCH
jgi:hypothetical protein